MLRFQSVLIALIAVVSATASLPAGEPLSIPLEVFEARRLDVPGADRRGGGVRVGIPLPEAMGVVEADGRPALALEGAEAWQFRTLARWPNGNVRWAAVTFSADCEAGQKADGFRVVPGKGVSAGTPLASEAAGVITVDTGALVVSIREKGFNFFDRAAIKGTVLVKPGAMDAVVTDMEGRTYAGSADGTAVIEENGPAGCVIRATGSNRDKDGKRMLGYIVRMHFFRNRSDVRVAYTCTNDEAKENPDKITVRDIRLVVPLAPTPNAVRGPGLDNGATVGPGEAIAYYQARPKGDTQHGTGKEDMAPEAFGAGKDDKGYWIRRGDEQLAGGPAEASPDLMWLDAVGADGAGVTAGIRFARGNYPKALRVAADGALSVGLWPEESKVAHVIAHGSHNTFEVLFDFHAQAAAEPERAMYRFQYPLVGRCPVAWYNRCIGEMELYPLYHFVSRAEEEALAKERGWPSPLAGRRRDMVVIRSWYWGDGGYRNQHDFARIAFVNFLRDENIDRAGAYYLYAEDRINYNCDWSIHHGEGRTDFGRQGPVGVKINFEEEHVHWYGIPLFYYGTGDQRVGDAGEEFVRKFREDRTSDRMYGWIRFLGWATYFLAAGHDMTGEEPFREGLRVHARNVVEGKAQWSKEPSKYIPEWPVYDMDWQRGAFSHGGVDWRTVPAEPALTWKPGLMEGYIIHDAFWFARTRFPWDDPCGDRLEDICEGIEWLVARECFMEDKEHGFFLPYVINLNGETKINRIGSGTVGTAQCAVLLPLLANGEEYADDLAERVAQGSFAAQLQEHGFSLLDHPGCQALLYYLLHQKADREAGKAPERVSDLAVQPAGKGRVRIAWTTPPGTAKIQIRYAPGEMVPYLDWDREKKAYAFDPDTHTNWWAAEHVHAEPAPAPGKQQSMTADLTAGLKIDGKPFVPGTYYFAIRCWSADNNRSAISNQVKVEVE